MTMPFDYLRDPDAIYSASFAAIEREVPLGRYREPDRSVVSRIVHACGMPDIADDIRMSEDFSERAVTAMREGCTIYCDAQMVAHGIIARFMPKGVAVNCLIADATVATDARSKGTTRSAAQVDRWTDRSSICVIGNAPTALFRLIERINGGSFEPAAIIGVPVGFVGAAESKLALHEQAYASLTILGRRGGSAMAAAAVNALAIAASS